MHCDQTLNHFFIVLPLLLVGVIVAVGIHLGRQSLQLHSVTLLFDGLHADLFACCVVLDQDNALLDARLLFHDDVRWSCGLGKLFLCLIEHSRVLLLLLHKLWVITSCHSVEVLPARDLSSLRIFLHANLLEASACGRAAMITESHASFIVVAVIVLHVKNTDVAHLAISLRLAWQLAPTVFAHSGLAVAVCANLHTWRYMSVMFTLSLGAAPGHLLLLGRHTRPCSLRLLSAAFTLQALLQLHLLVPHWIQILL